MKFRLPLHLPVWILLFSTPVFSQWTQLPEPLGARVFQFDKDKQDVFALTLSGVFKSNDSGASWMFLTGTSQFENEIWQMQVENGRVYLFLNNENIVRSDDGGKTWTTILAKPYLNGWDSEKILRFFASGDSLFVATNQTIYRSFDRGATWAKTVNYSEDQCLNFARIGQNIFIASDRRLWKSDDGGLTWKTTFQNAHGIAAFSAFDSTLFLLYEGFRRISRSKNLGQTWSHFDTDSLPDLPYAQDFPDYLFKIGDTLVHLTDQGCFHGNLNIHFSADEGETWHSTSISNMGVHFTHDAVVLGQRLLLGTNEGVLGFDALNIHFKKLNASLNAKSIYQIVGFKDKIWVATGDTLYSTDKNGRQWKPVLVEYSNPMCGRDFTLARSDKRLFLIKPDHCSLLFTDDGENWNAVKPDTTPWLCGDYAITNEAAWVVSGGKLFKMLDSQSQFVQIAAPDSLPEYGIGIVSGNGVITLDFGHKFYYSFNEGQTWDTIPPFFVDGVSIFGNIELLSQKEIFVSIYFIEEARYRNVRFDFETKTWEFVSLLDAETLDTIAMPYYSVRFLQETGNLVWAAIDNFGLYSHNRNSKLWRHFQPHPPSRFISAVYFDDETMWVGSYASGIYVGKAPKFGLLPGEDFELKIYPNPSSGAMTLESNLFFESESRLEIFNAAGQRVESMVLAPGQLWQKDFALLASGFYLLRLQSPFGAKTTKWIKFQ